jgi:[CysO sulfur-carrier protein]-S-L-cysteine hydrolase
LNHSSTPDSVKLPAELIISPANLQIMLSEVNRLAPEEACGLLAGEIKGITAFATRTFPIANAAHSVSRFTMAPAEQLAAFYEIEKDDLELVGIYHSHPHGPAAPSSTDIIEAYYPEVVQLIWSQESGEWSCNAFTIRNGIVESAALKVVSSG